MSTQGHWLTDGFPPCFQQNKHRHVLAAASCARTRLVSRMWLVHEEILRTQWYRIKASGASSPWALSLVWCCCCLPHPRGSEIPRSQVGSAAAGLGGLAEVVGHHVLGEPLPGMYLSDFVYLQRIHIACLCIGSHSLCSFIHSFIPEKVPSFRESGQNLKQLVFLFGSLELLHPSVKRPWTCNVLDASKDKPFTPLGVGQIPIQKFLNAKEGLHHSWVQRYLPVLSTY